MKAKRWNKRGAVSKCLKILTKLVSSPLKGLGHEYLEWVQVHRAAAPFLMIKCE